MSGIRPALIFGAIPIGIGIIYLVLQLALGDPAVWELVGVAGDGAAAITGTMDPAGVTLLLALGLAMGFGMFVILRGARDL